MASLGDMLAQSGVKLPSINVGSVTNWILYIGLAIFVAAIVLLGVFWLILYFKFNKKIKLFKKIGKNIELVAVDKGMFERIGSAGDYWLKTKKFKKILARPKLQMTKNEYWYFEREDGEWINFILDDIDALMKTANVKYIDEDMRLQRLGIQKNLKERYEKTSFWDKYGNTILSVGFVLVVTLCLLILFKELGKNMDKISSVASAIEKLVLAVRDFAQCSGSSGIVPINATVL